MPLPCVFAHCVRPFSLCWCRGSVFFCLFLSVFDPPTAFATWCPIFRSEAHVSVLSSSVQSMAQLFSCRAKFNVRWHLLFDVFFSFMPLPCVFARCVRPFSLCWCRGSVFCGIFLSVFDPPTAFATWCPIFRSEAHVSVLSSSVQGKAQQFSCRVKFNVRSHLSLDGILRSRTFSTADDFSR